VIPKLMTFAGVEKYLRPERDTKPMKQPIIVLQPNTDGSYELCLSTYGDNMDRLQHEDFTLSVESLWELKRQIDRELVEIRCMH
jgi:hypothetical protein